MVVEIVGHALAAEDNYPIEKPIRLVSFVVFYDAYAQRFSIGEGTVRNVLIDTIKDRSNNILWPSVDNAVN